MRAIRHTGIVVSDLEKTLCFYRDILGLKVVQEKLESGSYIDNLIALKDVLVKTIKMSADDGSLIELLFFLRHKRKAKNRNIYDIGYSHIAFTLKDLDSEYRRLKKAGVKFNSPPQISPDGKVKVVFCRDPEGNFIELVEELL